jgi:hypothetical protein
MGTIHLQSVSIAGVCNEDVAMTKHGRLMKRMSIVLLYNHSHENVQSSVASQDRIRMNYDCCPHQICCTFI